MYGTSKTLGILGGLGPMSSVYFYEMLTSHTKADKDQDHLNILISSRADTPDRTDFILGRSNENPLYVMKNEVARLIGAGADVIAIPCNTAHNFYEQISADCSVPVINIIRQTALFCHREGIKRVGVLATEGTVASGAYRDVFAMAGIECVFPDKAGQDAITDIIYSQVKKGIAPEIDLFFRVADGLKAQGCDRIILGCTELSLIKRMGVLDADLFLDSLEVLACSAIKMCGKQPTGFDAHIMSFCV